MTKKLIGALLAIVVLSGGLYVWMTSARPQRAQESLPAVTPLAAPATMADVAAHNTQASCWTVIDGGVYDLTGWIPRHPGGERAILRLCGTDGTQAFHGQHGDSQQQATILAHFKIGTLAK